MGAYGPVPLVGGNANRNEPTVNLSGADSIMKPLLAAAMKVAGKGRKGDGKKKATAKATLKAKVKVAHGG